MIYHHISEVPKPTAVRGFVPTMGALHEGHLSLIRQAKRTCEEVAVSVFVNPTQFGPSEDFDKYPRMLERDAELAMSAGADWIFAPSPEEMYPNGPTLVHVPIVTDHYEGARRPGHFDGVATVVLKLFNIVRPEKAFFGLKDIQQCVVLRKMVADLNVPVQLVFCGTVREADGLAMSSRNRYLSEAERKVAPVLNRELERLADQPYDEHFASEVAKSAKIITEHGFEVDYLEVVDLNTMTQVTTPTSFSAVVVAAKLGHTRLIDNRIL